VYVSDLLHALMQLGAAWRPRSERFNVCLLLLLLLPPMDSTTVTGERPASAAASASAAAAVAATTSEIDEAEEARKSISKRPRSELKNGAKKTS
jgi:hypothetical protein